EGIAWPSRTFPADRNTANSPPETEGYVAASVAGTAIASGTASSACSRMEFAYKGPASHSNPAPSDTGADPHPRIAAYPLPAPDMACSTLRALDSAPIAARGRLPNLRGTTTKCAANSLAGSPYPLGRAASR